MSVTSTFEIACMMRTAQLAASAVEREILERKQHVVAPQPPAAKSYRLAV
jgi:hypothetical protein